MKLVTDPALIAELEGTAPPSRGREVTDPALIAELEGAPAAAYSPVDAATEFVRKASGISPIGVGMKLNEMATIGFNKAGERAAELLAGGVTPKVDPRLPFPLNVLPQSTPGSGLRTSPEVAAGVGTALQMAPDILSTALSPTSKASKAPGALTKSAEEMTRRGLGYSKRQLSNDFSRKMADEAAKIALKRKILPASGNPKVAMENVEQLLSKSGSQMGRILEGESTKFNVREAVEALDKLRPAGKGGRFDSLHKQIDDAVDTLKGLGSDEITYKQANEVRKLLQDSVNYSSDKASQTLAKKIAGTVKDTVDSSFSRVSKRGGSLLRAKKNYSAGKSMKDALSNRISSEDGNNLFTPTSTLLGGMQLASGNVSGAAATLGMIELLKRRGNSALSRLLSASDFASGIAGTQAGPATALLARLASRTKER